jgi:hypothetical protein
MRRKKTAGSASLDLCAEFIRARFGDVYDRELNARSDIMIFISVVEPYNGGNACVFDESKLAWVDSGQDFTSWMIWSDVTVSVGYLEPKTESGNWFFRLGHPREVAELLHLLRQSVDTLAAPLSESRIVKLSEVADLYTLLPDGRSGWRALDLRRLPKGMPRDMRRAVDRRLVQDYDTMTCGKTREPPSLSEVWPEFFNGLPDAAPFLRAGYVLQKDRAATRALDLAFEDGARHWSTFAPVLVVPRGDGISAFFLREFLAGDRAAGEHLQYAFSLEHDLATVCALLRKLPVTMPSNLTDQIRLAAQSNLMRQGVLEAAFRLAGCPVPFREAGLRHREAMRAINKMVAANQAC